MSGEKAANGGYIGNDKEAIAFSESEMAAYAGKALKVELDYSLVSGTAGTITVYSKNPDYSWAVLKETDYIDLEYTYNQYKQVEVPAGKATLILSADVVDAAIAGKGLGIQVNRNVVLNSVKLSAVEVETPDAPDTPVEPEEPEVVITSKDGAGSITFADSSWWTEQDLPIEKLLAGVAVEDVESITFTCDTSFIIGYKDVNGGWTQTPTDSATTTYTVEDVALEKFTDGNGDAHEPDFNVYLSKGDSVKYTINWTVNKKEQVLDMTYNLSAGVTVGGYGYSEENGVVTFAKQYQEIRYTLPKVVDTATYSSLTIDVGAVKGDIAVKLYDAGVNQLAIKYGVTGEVTFDLANLDDVAIVAIMATTEGENVVSVEPSSVVVAGSSVDSLTYGLKKNPNQVTVGGYGYSIANGVVTFAKQYQEIRYTLPNVIDTTTYKSVTIDMGTVKGDVAVKLYDASTKELAIKYGATGTVTFDIAELEGVITIAIMATSEGENIASVEPKTVVFTANKRLFLPRRAFRPAGFLYFSLPMFLRKNPFII